LRSKNGSLKDSALAARAIWIDASKRLPIDERRVYASGFSGGARVASIFPQVIDRAVAGIIGCGAGLAVGLEPGGMKAAAYFGLTGLRDFNYEEMKNLDLTFDPTGLPHRFFFFEGVHDWPDSAYCERAVGWMEVMAVKNGLRPRARPGRGG
jgi:predicted esterase